MINTSTFSVKTVIKSLLPKPIYNFFRERRKQYSEKLYFNQNFTRVKCGNYEIEVPENHLLVRLSKSQPYRDLCLGISTKYISTKYPNGTIIDIGANVGDTAAIIATYSRNKLILIEGSDYFFDILVRNTAQISNEIITKKVLVSDGTNVIGSFSHWGGTASFNEDSDGKIQTKTERLADIADINTCFIKTDTDGYDFKILTDSLEWLAERRPAIFFENQIMNIQDLECSNELYRSLMQIGYSYFIVWDDPGFHLVSTTSLDTLIDLNRYLFKVWQNNCHISICNYDVLCLHRDDEDIYHNIREWYKTY